MAGKREREGKIGKEEEREGWKGEDREESRGKE